MNEKGHGRKRSLAKFRDLLEGTEENHEKVSIIGVPAEIRKGTSEVRKRNANYSVCSCLCACVIIKSLREEE
jgi:hypothetical protein